MNQARLDGPHKSGGVGDRRLDFAVVGFDACVIADPGVRDRPGHVDDEDGSFGEAVQADVLEVRPNGVLVDEFLLKVDDDGNERSFRSRNVLRTYGESTLTS